jgi:anti-sigma regulatory factor (Ser/Thr protein kinase)
VAKLAAAVQPDAERAAGRGLILMRTIMDEAHHNDAGNEVTLVKRRATDEESERPA